MTVSSKNADFFEFFYGAIILYSEPTFFVKYFEVFFNKNDTLPEKKIVFAQLSEPTWFSKTKAGQNSKKWNWNANIFSQKILVAKSILRHTVYRSE